METTVASNTWQKIKLLVKGLIIGTMVLILMIPAWFVNNLIEERESRQAEATLEVSSKWAGPQNVSGPILVLPYRAIVQTGDQTVPVSRLAYVLPDKFNVQSTITPEKRHRGIFEVMLYSATINMTGRFNNIPLQKLGLTADQVDWKDAYVCLRLTDAKGLREELKMKWSDSSLVLNPSTPDNAVMREGFTAPVIVHADSSIDFSATVNVNGSGNLLFTPVGKETTVELSSKWKDPSFTGAQLPEHSITADGFNAKWTSLGHTRSFQQAWKNERVDISSAAFGTNIFIAVSDCQKVSRSVKYAILCILLTFAAFFIMEVVNKRSVHPFQYGLIGLALILFYTLLLSFSEYTGFNIAYIMSTLATIGLIGWFVRGILQSVRLSTILGLTIVLMYGYVFTILQIQDYSLLLGSIGLFITLAVIMNYSRKISW